MKTRTIQVLLSGCIIVLLAGCAGTPAGSEPAPLPPTSPAEVISSPTVQPTALPVIPAIVIEAGALLPELPAGYLKPVGPVLPVGVATNPSGSGVAFYGLDGSRLGEISTPGTSPSIIHIGGPYEVVNTLDFPLVFYSDAQGAEGLMLVRDAQVTPLALMDNLTGLVGIPGQPILAYSTMELIQDTGTIRNRVFLGTLDSLAAVSPILEVNEPESRLVLPVLIRTEEGSPVGIWFTRHPYGIGGDIIFTPNEGLYYLDFKEQAVFQVLPAEDSFSAISPDQTRVAYSTWQNGLSLLNVKDLSTGTVTSLPLLPDTDRGAGEAVFSSGNFIAWKEVRGRLADGTLYQTIRVSTADGILLPDLPESAFYTPSGFAEITWLNLLGWVDDQTFLVQARESEAKEAATVLLRVNIASGEITYLAPGMFLEFLQHP